MSDVAPEGFDAFAAAEEPSQDRAPAGPSLINKAPTSLPSAQADAAPEGFDAFATSEDNQEKYGTGGQQAIAGLEGLAKGVAGPLATYAETKLGVPAEDISGRAEANPWTHGLSEASGLMGSMFTGVGLGAKVAQAGAKAAEVANFGKIGSAVLKGAIETGLIQGSDEISKAILGKGDPEAPFSSAIANMGAASLLGGALGGIGSKVAETGAGALKRLSSTQTAQKASKFIEDFGNRWKFNKENPSLFDAIKEELGNFHGSTSSMADEVYGSHGLKAQAIEQLVPEMNPKIVNQSQEIASDLQNKIAEMVKNPDAYPSRLTQKLMAHVNDWMEVATKPEASSNDVFNATQDLKQTLQAYSKFDRQVGPLSAEKDFINVAKELQHSLVDRLEDTKVWGKAGELQKGVNKAFVDFLPAQKDFLSKFTTKVEGVPTIDPGKVNTYVNQLGKPHAEIKQEMLRNYVKAAERYREQITGLHSKLGVESPIAETSLNAVKGTLDEAPSEGAKFADYLAKNGPNLLAAGIAKPIGTIAGVESGGIVGGAAGHYVSSQLTPMLEKTIGRKLSDAGVSAVLRALSGNKTEGLIEALDYVDNARRGAGHIKNGVNSLFSAGKIGAQEIHSTGANDKDREKLKKFISSGELNNQIQNQLNMPSAHSPLDALQKFAHGGDVKAHKVSKTPAPPVLRGTDGVTTHFPEQAMMLGSAKGRINTYLNGMRPSENPSQLPFDTKPPMKAKENSYNKAIDIANKPLSVLGHIKEGTITPEITKHFTQMYPELYNHLSKKITDKIVENQMKGERPNYKIRQGLSLFLGTPLDSTFTPANIMAIQNVYMKNSQMQQSASNQPAKKPSAASTNGIQKLPKMYATPGQSAEADKQKRD
ncbi:MAG: hypothetical protein V4440_12970 [Pseudomonadota bacterium]